MTDDLAEKTLIMLEVIDVKYKNVLEENGQRQMVWIPKTLIPEFSEKSSKIFVPKFCL
jgi:putative transposon-encoded protein